MQCPICGSHEQQTLEMACGQFFEGLMECTFCNSSWSINHGYAELVVDTQRATFLEGLSESVEADDYTWAA